MAWNIGREFNLADWWMYERTTKLKSTNARTCAYVCVHSRLACQIKICQSWEKTQNSKSAKYNSHQYCVPYSNIFTHWLCKTSLENMHMPILLYIIYQEPWTETDSNITITPFQLPWGMKLHFQQTRLHLDILCPTGMAWYLVAQ